VLQIATRLFAEHGFRGTTMRQVAALGGLNLASGHYHYGSKRDLYLQVLRDQFASIRGELERHGAAVTADAVSRMRRGEIERLLRTRIQVMLEIIVGSPPRPYGALMQREMLDPSEALPVIVDELMIPMMRELSLILAHLEPSLSQEQLESCVRSVVGQILFYRVAMPALLLIDKRRRYPKGFADTAASHILEFTVGGLRHVAQRKEGKKRDR
jgi:AcrR family transcriptional regulator